MKKGNGSLPAFPPALAGVGGGLTKREWFAGVALQGLLAGDQDHIYKPGEFIQEVVSWADDILAELEKDNAE